MDTCIRGFSFMPENKVEVMDLQYIEGEELEKAWKTSRRQRQKEQEQRIWNEFVQEHDIVQNVCQNDPYQFLHNLPEATLKTLLEKELQNMQQNNETDNANESNQQESSEFSPIEGSEHKHFASLADEADTECDIFHIFGDDELSGQEYEDLNDSPCTVREIKDSDNDNDKSSISSLEKKLDEPEDSSKLTSNTAGRETEINIPRSESGRSLENVAHVIQSSIYCAKVKDIRGKIEEELDAITTSLDTQDLINVDPAEFSKTCKRSNEFCARFNRIYMYQLQRQIQDVKRNSQVTLPFAQHTQYQSQMVRITSLHQNILQALQVFHKSFEQTLCLRDSVAALHTLMRQVREADAACRSSPAPRHFAAAKTIYDDGMLTWCDKLDTALEYHAIKSDSILKNSEGFGTHKKSSVKFRGKKRPIGSWSKSGPKSVVDDRLSMYSVDTLRNLNPKPSNSKDSSTNKTQAGVDATPALNVSANKSGKGSNSQRKSPKLRRAGRRARAAADSDVQTMVQTVSVCGSAILSHDVTPMESPIKDPITKKVPIKASPRRRTPTSFRETPRSSITSTPRSAKRPPNELKNSQQSRVTKQKTKVKDEQSIKQEVKNISNGSSTAGVKDNVKELKSDKEDVKLDTPRPEVPERKSEKERDTDKVTDFAPEGCDVTTLLKKLCGGDSAGNKIERVSGARNAQLVCINGGSPRQPSTPQLLRILEETIQKKAPRPFHAKSINNDQDKLRLTFNISQQTADNIFQYRTKFVQHMLASPLYANSAVGKPWETIGNLSEKIIDEVLLNCAKEMEVCDVMNELYKCETR